jgi:hypothetical protein
MKKQTHYLTDDGKTFDRRLDARRHETDLHRRERMTEFFHQRLPKQDGDVDERSISTVVAAILADSSTFTECMSARAARRAAETGGLVTTSAGSKKSRRRRSPKNIESGTK